MRLHNLQILRIIGASLVALFHLASIRKGNEYHMPALKECADLFVGPAVWVFFALSGFVLVTSLKRTTAWQFALARFLRLYPAYWFVIAIIFTWTGPHLWGILFRSGPVWRGLLLVPAGQQSAAYSIGIEWTLIFEVFFCAMLCLFAVIHRNRGPIIGVSIWLAAVIGAMCWRHPGPYQPYPTWSQIGLSPFCLPFLLGALAVHLMPMARLIRYSAPVLIPLLFVSSHLIDRWDFSTLLMAIASALLVAWAATGRQVAENHPLVKYGDWSYGLYLTHVPLFAAGFRLVEWLSGEPSTPTQIIGVGCLAMCVGLTYGYCESTACRWMHRRFVSRGKRKATPVSVAQAA
jgi:exopolysaccharide production protein ExoZ